MRTFLGITIATLELHFENTYLSLLCVTICLILIAKSK
jgi:hypothetical protein